MSSDDVAPEEDPEDGIDQAEFDDFVRKALAAGKQEITVPRRLAIAYVVRAIAPGLMRRGTKRATIEALAKAQPASPGGGDA